MVDFWGASSRDKYYEGCRSNVHVKVKMLSEKAKMVKPSRWIVSVYGSFFVINRLWEHAQASRQAI